MAVGGWEAWDGWEAWTPAPRLRQKMATYVNRRPFHTFAKLSIHIFAEPEAKRKTISPTEAPAPIGFILINYI